MGISIIRVLLIWNLAYFMSKLVVLMKTNNVEIFISISLLETIFISSCKVQTNRNMQCTGIWRRNKNHLNEISHNPQRRVLKNKNKLSATKSHRICKMQTKPHREKSSIANCIEICI